MRVWLSAAHFCLDTANNFLLLRQFDGEREWKKLSHTHVLLIKHTNKCVSSKKTNEKTHTERERDGYTFKNIRRATTRNCMNVYFTHHTKNFGMPLGKNFLYILCAENIKNSTTWKQKETTTWNGNIFMENFSAQQREERGALCVIPLCSSLDLYS